MIGCSYLYFMYTFLASYIFCEYFIPICDLSFHFPSVFLLEESFNFNEVESIFSFMVFAFCVLSQKPFLTLTLHGYSSMFLLGATQLYLFHFSLRNILFLFMFFSYTWCELEIKIN